MSEYVKLAEDQVPVFNDTFLDQVESGNVKEASVSAQAFTRDKLREDSFAEKILTPLDLANTDLDKAEDPEFQVKWCDRESDQAPAVTVPLGVVPDGYQFKGDRYPVYFTRLMTPVFEKDLARLRGYGYDIRQILLENSTKDLSTEVDTRFITKIDASIGTIDAANALNGLGLPQYVSITGGITRDNLVESFKVINRLKVPFGPMQKDGADSKGVILANNNTAMDLLKFNRSEAGGNVSESMFVDGVPVQTVLGQKLITTIKDDLVPDGTVYLFSSEEFLGKYFRLQPLTVFMESKAFFLSYFQYMEIGMSIGNVKGAVKIEF